MASITKISSKISSILQVELKTIWSFILCDLIKQEIQEWAKLYGRKITDEEYNEICYNLNGFFSTLKEWNDEERIRLENERTCSVGNSNNTSQT